MLRAVCVVGGEVDRRRLPGATARFAVADDRAGIKHPVEAGCVEQFYFETTGFQRGFWPCDLSIGSLLGGAAEASRP